MRISMPDYPPDVRSRVMRSIKSSGGVAERDLRSALWRTGLRFRVHDPKVMGKPDLVFPSAKVAVFVDSVFWHGKLSDEAVDRMSTYWREKLKRNRARDERVTRWLAESGWLVLRLVEDDVRHDLEGSVRRVGSVVRRRTHPRRPARPQIESLPPRAAARRSR